MNEIKGTTGADTLAGTIDADDMNGLAGNDILLGSAGADKIDGGAGIDTANYESSPAAITTDISSDQPNVAGDAEGDTLLNIERVIGSAFDDTLISSTEHSVLEGGPGNDRYVTSKHPSNLIKTIEVKNGGVDEVQTRSTYWTLAEHIENLSYTGSDKFTALGNTDDNVITGGKNDDNLYGFNGDDQLHGGEGNDRLVGGPGADQLNGGEGFDIAEYEYSEAVTINLKTGIHTANAEGDTYIDIERIVGSKKDDTFIGDAQPNSFDGGSGFDTIDYSTSPRAVTVNISSPDPQKGGDAEGDTLIRVKRAIGSPFDDTLTSSTNDSVLEGGLGNDVYLTSEQ
jgi:Ca2+-binding RTX toxin-like protein